MCVCVGKESERERERERERGCIRVAGLKSIGNREEDATLRHTIGRLSQERARLVCMCM